MVNFYNKVTGLANPVKDALHRRLMLIQCSGIRVILSLLFSEKDTRFRNCYLSIQKFFDIFHCFLVERFKMFRQLSLN